MRKEGMFSQIDQIETLIFVGPNSLVYEGSLSVELFCGGGNERQAIQ